MSATYPVNVEIESPVHFDRTLVLLRIVLAMVLAWIGITSGWVACALFAGLPLLAAIAIARNGPDRYLNEDGPRIWRGLTWLLQLSAFMLLLTDTFPSSAHNPVRFELQTSGKPTVGSALLRFITSIPSGIVLCLLGFIGGIVLFIAGLFALISAHVPQMLLAYLRGMLRWQTRLVAYHASLVDEYPPFSFDTSDHHALSADQNSAYAA
jgi:hypothetical protein